MNSLKNAEEHLPHFRVRPRFQVDTAYSAMDLAHKIENGLKQNNAPVWGQVSGHKYATLFLPAAEQHYWSPELSLTFEATEQGSLLRGLYGPRPAVWTMFIFFYFLISFAIVVIGIIGLSNFFLNKSLMVLWLVPVLIFIFLTLYLVAYSGQKLGHDQMVILHQFLEESIEMPIVKE